jgi:hypothetical protein
VLSPLNGPVRLTLRAYIHARKLTRIYVPAHGNDRLFVLTLSHYISGSQPVIRDPCEG